MGAMTAAIAAATLLAGATIHATEQAAEGRRKAEQVARGQKEEAAREKEKLRKQKEIDEQRQVETAVNRSRASRARALSGGAGARSTLLTSPLGLTTPPTTERKTLLGT